MRINRATVVYGAMILACALGEWAVLSFGERIVPPEDLAGKWVLEAPSAPAIKAARFGPEMSIDQSGRFFQVSFDNGPSLNLTLDQQTYIDVPNARLARLELVNGPWRMVAEGRPGTEQMGIRLTGPTPAESGWWNARRISRVFPADVSEEGSKGAH